MKLEAISITLVAVEVAVSATQVIRPLWEAEQAVLVAQLVAVLVARPILPIYQESIFMRAQAVLVLTVQQIRVVAVVDEVRPFLTSLVRQTVLAVRV